LYLSLWASESTAPYHRKQLPLWAQLSPSRSRHHLWKYGAQKRWHDVSEAWKSAQTSHAALHRSFHCSPCADVKIFLAMKGFPRMQHPNQKPHSAPQNRALTQAPASRFPLHSTQRKIALALLLLAALLAALGFGRAYRTAFAQTAGIDADALRDFEVGVVQAFIDNDGESLTEMSASSIRYANWEGENRIVAPDELVEVVDEVLVGPATAPVYLEDLGIDDIEAILGEDPLAFWGEDLPVVSVLLISGLTETDAGEALLAIAPNDDGAPLLVGILVAEEGLPAAPATGDESGDTGDEAVVEEDAAEEVAAEEEAAASATEETLPDAEEIVFDGAPAIASRTGTVDAENPVDYRIRAAAGQALTIDLSAAEAGANFSVVGERNRQPYKTLENPARIWTLTVPASQEYRVHITSEVSSDYVLTLLLSPVGHRLATPVPAASARATESDETAEETTGEESAESATTAEITAENTAQRIRFGVGETSATRLGTVSAGERIQYVLRVVAGQTLIVDVASDGDWANFALTGVTDGQPYKRLENEDRAFNMVVPTTQDYLISVATAAAAGVETDYVLYVEVPAQSAATPTPNPDWPPIDPVDNPVRLRVPIGGTSTSVTEIVSVYGADGYLLEAQAGQRMVVTVTSPDDIARFSISGYDDGVVLKPLDDQTTWSGILPSTQDYLVQVENPRGVRVQYTLDVEFSALGAVPPTNPVPTAAPTPAQPTAQRIVFPPGAISASVDGFLAPNEVQTYVLAANAGQSMTAVITSPNGQVGLEIVGADGTPYKRASVGGAGFSFTLPLTQDYYVSAVSQGSAANYSLSIIIVN